MKNLTFAPQPKWKHIAKAIFATVKSDEKIIQHWSLNNKKTFWFSRSAWSLYAIARFRMLVLPEEEQNIWIPSYFCNTSLLPIRALGVKLSFYPILFDGKPDLSVCNKMLKDNPPNIIVFVDYFGESLFSKELYDLAKNNNAWLVEDAVHCLDPNQSNTKFADFVLYSPHKLLAIPDGGLLIVSNYGPNRISYDLLEKYKFNKLYNSIVNKPESSNLPTYKWITKRLIQKLGLFSNISKVEFNNDVIVENLQKFPHPKISFITKNLLFNMVTELEEETGNRWNNYEEWNTSLSRQGILNDDIKCPLISYTPYLAVFTATDTNLAEKTFNLLKKAKIPVTTWPDLAPEVLNDIDKYRVTIKMRLTRIFLPVHFSINPAMIRHCLAKIFN